MATRFDEFTLDLATRQLLLGREPVHLSPKAFQLLSILIAQRPTAVSKSDLQDQLWPDTNVTENSLISLVGELRAALGDDAKQPRFVRTVYGFGYAFSGGAIEAEEDEPAGATALPDRPPEPVKLPPQKVQERRRVGWQTVAAAALLAVALGGGALAVRSRATVAAPVQTLAILPFQTIGPSEHHMGLALADLLITRIGNVHSLKVAPISVVRQYDGRAVDPIEAGRKLKVHAVLDGTIRSAPDRVRVTLRLVDVRKAKAIWGRDLELDRDELLHLEDDIAARVTDALTLKTTPQERTELARRNTSSSEAYEQYLVGRYYLARQNRESTTKAVEAFDKALRIDSSYALAWAGLSAAWGNGTVYRRVKPEVGWPRADAAAKRALELDPELPEAHASLGSLRFYHQHDFSGAESSLRKALRLDPANMLATRSYAHLLSVVGRHQEAIALRRRAIELDPEELLMQHELAMTYASARMFDAAERQSMFVLQIDPNWVQSHCALVRIYTPQRRFDEAIAHGRKALALERSSRTQLWLAYALASAGAREEASAILEGVIANSETDIASPWQVAVVYAALGDRDGAFRWLERSVESRSGAVLLKEPGLLDPLESDPRYAALLKRAGIPE